MAKKKSAKPAAKKTKHASPLNSSVLPSDDDDEHEEEQISMKVAKKSLAKGSTMSSAKENSKSKKGKSTGKDKSASSTKDKKGFGDMTQSKLAEEAALTALLFGGGDTTTPAVGSSGGAFGGSALEMDVDAYGQRPVEQRGREEENDVWNSGDLFAIDRAGVDASDDEEAIVQNDYSENELEEENSNAGDYEDRPNFNQDYESDEEQDDDDASSAEVEEGKFSMKGAAWQDDDDDSDSDASTDDKKGVSLVNGPNRLKKLRRYRDETDPLSFKEYELRLRERFVNTASVAARTDWADVTQVQQQDDEEKEEGAVAKRKKRGYGSSTEDESSDEDEEYVSSADRILESNATLFTTSSSMLPLPPTLLSVTRVRDGNLPDPNNSVTNVVQFHPTAGKDYDGSADSSDNPLLMTAGMDKMLRFFRVDGTENHKIHGIHFPTLPITCASFIGDSGSQVVLSGRRSFFFVYDAASGSIERVPSIMGRKERSLEKFTVSPDGQVIAFLGNDGYIILVDGKSKQWIGDLKMNGSVRAVSFSADSEFVMGSGSDGDIYRWHVRSRRCVERFHNEDGTITSSMATSSNFMAVGAESGVVNLYNDKTPIRKKRDGLSVAMTERTPVKSIMNMTSSADLVKFNDDGQILAMSTRRETNGLKLLHVPTATVFSNWPTSKTPLKYVWSMDFSPGSKYFAVGNDHGKCLLYQLKHYWDE